jgi:hypothetical protein
MHTQSNWQFNSKLQQTKLHLIYNLNPPLLSIPHYQESHPNAYTTKR